MGAPLKQRFVNRVELIPFTDCHIWTGATASGYGHIGHKGKNFLTHRLAWEWANERSAEGVCVLHKCDVRCCVNPAHLFAGDAKENALDMMRKGRHPSQQPDRVVSNLRKVGDQPEQRCPKCEQWLPATNLYFGAGGKALTRLSHWCRACVNQGHRERRLALPKVRKQRVLKPFCKRGHPYAGSNLGFWNGKRACKACLIELQRIRRQKQRSI